MSMTSEQKEKAALVVMKQMHEDMEKHNALMNHKRALEIWNNFWIPYKVAKDYLKTKSHNVINITDCYPEPGYPINADRVKVRVGVDTLPNDKFTPNEEKQAEIEQYRAKYRKWRFAYDDKDGFREWEYRFAHFFEGYDFETFTSFDFVGSNELQPCDLLLLQKFYKRIGNEYEKNRNAYIQTEPIYKDEYKHLFTDNIYDLVYEGTAKAERDALLKRIGVSENETEVKG